MGDETVADRARLTALVLDARLADLRRSARRPFRSALRRRVRPPARLVVAPQDIRTADPTIAADIYAGHWSFDGKSVNARGASPFEVEPPSEGWAAALASFGWLRHLRAADTALSRAQARALVSDWILGARRPAVVRAEVAARRLLSWLSQSPLILDGADAAFYRLFMRALARQADTLWGVLDRTGGVPRLTALVALSQLGLCAEGLGPLQRRASHDLGEEIGRQILPDGGHVSRNPRALLDLLPDLLPLRQVYTSRGVDCPAPLLDALDRMMPLVRGLRHGDGALALFNGMGATAADVAAAVLAHDGRGGVLADAPYSGYQRLEAAGAAVIVDAGRPPPLRHSAAAHAGTLALEFSRRGQRLIVNCGAASTAAAREASRATAAHSTLVLGDRSSSRFVPRGRLRGLVYAGPRDVRAAHAETEHGVELELSHDGYAGELGYVHARLLRLARDGGALAGEDRLVAAAGRRTRPTPFALRFHLHPSLRVTPAPDGAAASIVCPDGERWTFEAGGLAVSVEESVSFSSSQSPRRAEQIVVWALAPQVMAVIWRFTREGAAHLP